MLVTIAHERDAYLNLTLDEAAVVGRDAAGLKINDMTSRLRATIAADGHLGLARAFAFMTVRKTVDGLHDNWSGSS